ncbi:hypothetical protein LTR37_009483 [Vermiconidia calcicola]|uniref:Uncharacterized protein n=1 Tax=Vermiconidia calcicola TaxID=1690605 RepID=A0ACC3N7Q8_9PEZI|nr:hypothetical protein LTR37_009483 [Vermiconidia calcicola]
MSVNSRADSNFGSFVRAGMGQHHAFVRNSYQPQLQLQIPSSSLHGPQHAAAYFGQRPYEAALHHAPCSAQRYQRALTMNTTIGPNMLFEDLIHYPSEPYPVSKLESTPPLHEQSMPSSFSFRPLEGIEGTPSTFVEPCKVESSPLLPTPMVLSSEVDVSKYENVPVEDWVMAPTEYSPSSPSATDSFGSGPYTPISDYGSFSADLCFDQHYGHSVAGPVNDTGYLSFSRNGSVTSQLPAFFPNSFAADASWYTRTGSFNDMFPACASVPSSTYKDLQSSSHEPASASPQDIERPVSSQSVRSSACASSSQASFVTDDKVAERQQRNELLVEMRRKGHSYKEIKRLGDFREAESTLRGRVRMLTKEKWERVRKPQWKHRDVTLLRRAVKYYVREDSASPCLRRGAKKMPWKKVSEWMHERGSSYFFAPATCAKKWEELG